MIHAVCVSMLQNLDVVVNQLFKCILRETKERRLGFIKELKKNDNIPKGSAISERHMVIQNAVA